MVPRDIGNNAYAKCWRDKQRVLWYFLKWPTSQGYGKRQTSEAKCAFCQRAKELIS